MKKNWKITKKIIGSLCVLSMLSVLVPKGQFSANQTDYAPEFYGTTNITIRVGDELDLNNSFYRILAKDYEDGNVSKDIKILRNTVNRLEEGTYEIVYQVSDSVGNTTQKTVPVNVVSEGERKIQRTLYTLSDVSHMNDTGFYRGNNHDRQSLGIYLPAGTSVSVKQVNSTGKDLEVEYLNNDGLKESVFRYAYAGGSKDSEEKAFMNDHSIIVNNTNTTIGQDLNQSTTLENVVSVRYKDEDNRWKPWEAYEEKSFDSVPFVKTLYNTNGDTPVIEITLNDDIKPLDYYTYGDSMEEFKNQWRDSKNEVALLEGSRCSILVPYVDLEDLGISKKDTDENHSNDIFNSIDDILTYYDGIIEEYDEWIGLSYDAEKPTDKNVKTKYFLKADVHEVGYAAYSYQNYFYRTDYSLESFLHNTGDGWAILHEIGHGYQGNIKYDKELYLGEISNNILAHYYQKANLTGSWLEDIANIEKEVMENVRKEEWSYLVDGNGEEGTENVDSYHIRLYAYVNLLNKIGPKESMAGMYSYYRENYDSLSNTNASDIFSIGFSNSSGYNVIPYFKEWKLDIDKNTENEIYNKDYPIVYFLRDLVKDDTQAEKIKEELSLEGIYSLVSNEDISKYNLKGNININLTEEEFNNLKDYDIILKSGENVEKQIKVTSQNLTISDVPIGAYEIETTRPDKIITPRYVVAQQDNTNDVTLTTEDIELAGISITTPPNKTQYIEGEDFDATGMLVTATYNNGSTKEVTNYTITNGTNLKSGAVAVIISYTENGITKETAQTLTVEEKLKITIRNYEETAENGTKYIQNIKVGTKIQEVLNNIDTNGTARVYKGSTRITDANTKVATGMTIRISLNNQEVSYTTVVAGDLNGDGEMGDIDLLRLVRYNAELDTNLSGAYLRAADIYKDGNYADSKDLLKLARVLAGVENL